uniref:Uncharacterized protein n=1 Tax=Rhizophora mucronata TaxID=61149 RepID=A0A2P2QSE0_RHIMU
MARKRGNNPIFSCVAPSPKQIKKKCKRKPICFKSNAKALF